MNEVNFNDLESVLAGQIPEAPSAVENTQSANIPVNQTTETQQTTAPAAPVENRATSQTSLIGQKLENKIGNNGIDMVEANKMIDEQKLTRIGQKIGENTEYRDGWLNVPKSVLGDRAKFYPEEWEFKIRPATVDTIKSWSTLDDENANSIDDVFNEILKTCLSISTPYGPMPWGNIRSWDRFFFILLIREYTFQQGERKVSFNEDCINCDNPVEFNLVSSALEYDLPDPEVMKYFSEEGQVWLIDPVEFEVNEEPITLYLPTLDKDANIKAWLIQRLQDKKKIDNVFIKFLPWMSKTISKDLTIANKQIRDLEIKFKSWDTEMFSLMDEILRNIVITPASKLITKCPICGEEVTADIRFPNGVRGLFAMGNKHKKFGNK
jgi:hypothetical protein